MHVTDVDSLDTLFWKLFTETINQALSCESVNK